jgi:triacylglycerol lipase
VLDSLSPQRRRFVVGVIALGVAVVLVVVITTVVSAISARVTPVAQDDPGPVLLVPGYGGTGASLAPLATALRSAGRDVVVVTPLGDGTGDLVDQAKHLGSEVDRVLSETGAASVDVIGYSAGGVVARAWARDEGGAGQARRIVTLGSPQHGTSQAALGAELAGRCPPACEQLVPDSDLLRHLNAGDETPRGPLWATLRSSADEVVTPVDSAMLAGAVNVLVQDVCPGATPSHGDLPTDPVVIAALGSLLGTAPPTAPTGVTC